MLTVRLYDPEGEPLVDIDTEDGVVPRVGEVIRIETDHDIAGDYKVEFVRWNMTDGEGCSVQVMAEKLAKKDLWPEGAPEASTGKVLKFQAKKPKDQRD